MRFSSRHESGISRSASPVVVLIVDTEGLAAIAHTFIDEVFATRHTCRILMVDFAKKVRGKAGGDLLDGEPILDARVVQPAGQALRVAMSAAAWRQAAGSLNVLIRGRLVRAEAAAQREVDESGAMAAGFPDDKCSSL